MAVDPDLLMTPRLTSRERELLALVREGLSNREIGARLGIGEQTVKNALSVLFEKFAVRNRTQLAIAASAHAGKIVDG